MKPTARGTAWSILKETVSGWDEDNVSRLAASLAYYTLLSIAPLIILTVAVVGLVFGESAARQHIAGELASVVGASAGEAVQSIAENAKGPAKGIVSIVVGMVVLLFGASGVFGELQSALNTVWSVAPRPGRGIWGVIKDRFFSFTLVLGVAFLLLVSLILSAALSWVGQFFEHSLPGGALLWQALNVVISLLTISALFALMFKKLPDVEIRWRDAAIGATVTAGLFTLGKFGLGLYLGTAAVSSAYGAAGSIVALVIWVYYSSQVVLLGAEFTEVFARHFGAAIKPNANAIALPRAAEPTKAVAH